MVSLPPVDSLRCFCAAAKVLNFRAASRAVSLTPAAFGQRIKQLEEQLGAQLFVRTTRSVRLSTAGLSLLPVAQRALASMEDCTRAVSATTVSYTHLEVRPRPSHPRPTMQGQGPPLSGGFPGASSQRFLKRRDGA